MSCHLSVLALKIAESPQQLGVWSERYSTLDGYDCPSATAQLIRKVLLAEQRSAAKHLEVQRLECPPLVVFRAEVQYRHTVAPLLESAPQLRGVSMNIE
jgi:hypothetical protein